MPATTPKYVRLTQHMLLGCHVDINTGWGISGRDVQEVPDNPAVQAFVRAAQSRGILEEASEEEYNEIQEANFNPLGGDIPRVIMVDPSKPLAPNVLDTLVRQHGAQLEERFAQREQDLLRDREFAGATDMDLRSRLSAQGINSGGSRSEVIARLQATKGSSEPSEPSVAPVDETRAEKPFDDMSKKELQVAARNRGLSTAGNVEDLVERLEAYAGNRASAGSA